MKKIVVSAIGAMLVGSLAMAADAEKSNSHTTDVSKNPITGTKTTTKKSKSMKKGAGGMNHEAVVTETTKQKTDGTVTKEVEVDAETSTKK